MAERISNDAYKGLERLYPHGRKCPRCGHVLSIREFPLRRAPEGIRPGAYCRDCRAEVDKAQHAKRSKRKREGITSGPSPSERQPIPELQVGRMYEVIDTGRTWQGVSGGDGNSKPLVYRGPCVARWGRNWGIATSTGIRTFSPGQLVGLQVREVA